MHRWRIIKLGAGLGAVVTALCVSASGAPATTANPAATAVAGADPIAIEVERGDGVIVRNHDGAWVSRTQFTFAMTFTDVDVDNDEGLSVFISIPEEADVRGYDGERWDCWDVDGGLECANPDLVVPGEAWPTLGLRGQVLNARYGDTLDVYATGQDQREAHWGVRWDLDTSL
jgi:hypothetical protein